MADYSKRAMMAALDAYVEARFEIRDLVISHTPMAIAGMPRAAKSGLLWEVVVALWTLRQEERREARRAKGRRRSIR